MSNWMQLCVWGRSKVNKGVCSLNISVLMVKNTGDPVKLMGRCDSSQFHSNTIKSAPKNSPIHWFVATDSVFAEFSYSQSNLVLYSFFCCFLVLSVTVLLLFCELFGIFLFFKWSFIMSNEQSASHLCVLSECFSVYRIRKDFFWRSS